MGFNPCQHIVKPIPTKNLHDHCNACSSRIQQSQRDGQPHFRQFFSSEKQPHEAYEFYKMACLPGSQELQEK